MNLVLPRIVSSLASIRPALLLAGGLFVAACGGEEALEPTFANVEKHILKSCTAGCHSSEYEEGNLLILTPGEAYAQLIDQPLESELWEGSEWADYVRVKPGDPDKSAMVVVVEQPLGLHTDLQMPPGGRISEAEKTLLREWVAAGAPKE